jgi:subtilisin
VKTIKAGKIIYLNRKVNKLGGGDKLKKVIALFFVAFLLLANFLVVLAATESWQKIPVIVGFKDKSDVGLIGKHGGDVKYQYSLISAVACSLSQGAIEALERNPRVAYLELDGKVQMTQDELPHGLFPIPFDGVDRIDAELVHPYNKGTGVKVAILDTGIDYNHDELKNRFEDVKGYDFVEADGDPMDDNGHGTLCAGIVAAENNGLGVAPETTLYSVKVLDDIGNGDISNVIAGIEWSIENGMNIISMSLRSTKDNQPLHQVCDAAYNAGILVVAAAGNDYRIRGKNKELDTVGYPARYDSVIAVGATDNTDTRASYSSTGSTLELAAPGDYINSTMLGNIYAIGSGTSMACPHVSGTAALVFKSEIDSSYDLDGDEIWDAFEVREKLKDTADDLGSPGWDSWYGYGLVDANADPSAPSIIELKPPVGALINTATPTISATVTDTDDIAFIEMMLDEIPIPDEVIEYTPPLVSYTVPTSAELFDGFHKVALTASDGSNEDVTSWSFTVDTIPPAEVPVVNVVPISSSSLFISWPAITDPGLVIYKVYRKAPGEDDHTWMRVYVGQCSEDEEDEDVSFPDTGLEPNAEYSYKISAVDMAGNEGPLSPPGVGTTMTPEGGLMHVESIFMDWTYGMGTNQKHKVVLAEARVLIADASGVPVSGATVYGQWQGATTDSDTGVTNSMGIATIRSDTVRNPEDEISFTFAVENVDKEGWNYDSSGETEGNITYP